MSLVDQYHAAHKARQARLGAPSPYQAPIWKPIKVALPPPKPYAPDAGWESMWFWDLVTRQTARPVQIREIQAAVCRQFHISMMDMLSARRTLDVAEPRQIAMYLSRKLTLRGYPEIGRKFGNRDHTTIIHGVRKIEGLIESSPFIANTVSTIERSLFA